MEICAQVGELVQRGQRLIEVENDALHLALAKSEQQLDNVLLTYQQLLEKPVAELIVQQQRLNQERLGLESALMEIGRFQVRAPLSGVVISQEVQPGDAVVANQVWGYYR